MQHFLKAFIRAAGARIISAELLEQFLVTVYDAVATLHVRLGREPSPTLTRPLESRVGRRTHHDRTGASGTSF
jgi:hypothetical protein